MAEGGSVDSWTKREDNEEGVHRTTAKPGESMMGAAVRQGDPERAKRIAIDKIKEQRPIGDRAKKELMAHGGEMDKKQRAMAAFHGKCPGPECPGCEAPKCMAEGGMMTDSGYQDDDEVMAEGGMTHETHQSAADELDMVGRVLAKHAARYSEGGRVANANVGESASMPGMRAKDDPNEFDDLALRDDLESDYTGTNSGDELGNSQEDSDEADIIARIMRSKKKRDTMAVPGEGSTYGKNK